MGSLYTTLPDRDQKKELFSLALLVRKKAFTVAPLDQQEVGDSGKTEAGEWAAIGLAHLFLAGLG